MFDRLNLDGKKMEILCTVVTVLVLGFLLYFVFGGSLAFHQEKFDEFKGIREEQYTLEAMIGELIRGEEVLDSIQETMDSLESRVPRVMAFQDFYDAVSENARVHNLLLSEMQPGDLVEQELFTVLPVSIEATGSFENFCDFLYGVLHMPRLAKLAEISIVPSGNAPLCNIRMTLNIFAKLEDASDAG